MATRFDKLIEIIGVYQREAKRCGKAKAYVSGCIALGAVLETQLLALCTLYRHRLRRSPSYVKTSRQAAIADNVHVVREIRDLALAGRWIRKYKSQKISAARFR